MFLDWFRSKFPYFHDGCSECGASCKDEPTLPSAQNESGATFFPDALNLREEHEQEYHDDEVDDDDDVSFLGYVYPSSFERLGDASRTELYRCRSCLSYTRFPRYNRALYITTTQRGRCGEYSLLLYRMLRALGYEKVRWVVDWADHVWAEVWLGGNINDGIGNAHQNDRSSAGGRWVHLDPCEAAVDNPLLYESWGKNQTYIMAFSVPSDFSSGKSVMSSAIARSANIVAVQSIQTIQKLSVENENGVCKDFPAVEDVTERYTSDDI